MRIVLRRRYLCAFLCSLCIAGFTGCSDSGGDPQGDGIPCSSDADCADVGMMNGHCLQPAGTCFDFGRCISHQQCLDMFSYMQAPYCQFDGLCRDDGPCSVDADCAAAGWVCNPDNGTCRYESPDGDADAPDGDGGDVQDEEPAVACPAVSGVYPVAWECPAPGKNHMMVIEQQEGSCDITVHSPDELMSGIVASDGHITLEATDTHAGCEGDIQNGYVHLSCGEGCGAQPAAATISGTVSVTPGELMFDVARPGEEITKTLEIRNTGSGGLAMYELYFPLGSPSGFSIENDGQRFPRIIAPGEAVTLSLRYQSDEPEPVTGQLAIVTSDAQPRAFVPLMVRCEDCDSNVSVDTHVLRFGVVNWWELERKTVTVTNQGDTEVHISSIDMVDSDDGGFELDASVETRNITLAAGASWDVGVFFHPLQNMHPKGRPVRGRMRINMWREELQFFIPVALHGSVEIPTPPCIHLEPVDVETGLPQVAFGDVLRGNSATRTMTISNCGDEVLNISDMSPAALVSIRDPEFFFSPALPVGTYIELAPDESFSLDITFVPQRVGEQSHGINIISNATLSDIPVLDNHADAVQVPLAGTGLQPSFSLVPSGLDLGYVPPGCCTPEKIFRVFHTAAPDEIVTISDISLPRGYWEGTLEVLPETALPVELAAGESLAMTVRYCADEDILPDCIDADIAVSGGSNGEILHINAHAEVFLKTRETMFFQQRSAPGADIMVGVGCGPHMEVYQQRLANGLTTLLDRADAAGADIRIQVFPTGRGGVQEEYYPVLAYGGEDGMTRQELVNAFAEQVAMGEVCDDEERPMEVVFDLLSLPEDAGTLQRRSDMGLGLGLVLMSTADALDVDAWAAARLVDYAVVHNPEDLGVSVLAGPCPDGCQEQSVSVEPACGYASFAESTEGEVYSICEESSSEMLFGALADRLFVLPKRFVLPQPFEYDDFWLSVNGEAVSNYTLDIIENTVVFDEPPVAGASIMIHYWIGCR